MNAPETSEERYGRFLGSLDELVFEFDHDGRYLQVWAGDENLLKQPRQELLGRRVDEIVSHELAEKIHASFRRIRATGKPESFEYPLEVPSGIRWFLARIALVPPDGEGEATFSFVARDITGIKELEQSLRESQRRFRGLFDNAAIGMALVGADERCLEANACLCDMLGYSLEELRRLPFSRYSHPEDNRSDLEQLDRLARREITSYRMEKRFIRKDGHEIWGLLTVSLERDESGTPLYFIAVVQNISRRKRAEAEKERILQEMETIFANAADGIIFFDTAGRILRINPAGKEITGLSDEDMSLSLTEQIALAAPRQADGTPLPMEKTGLYQAMRGIPQKGEIVQIRRRDGQDVWISFSAAPLVDATGRPVGTIATFTDITRQREMQVRLEDFVHMLAHDLRTPLTVISGHAQLLEAALQGTPLAEKGAGARAIIGASGQMEQMMEEMVHFGLLESGQLLLHDDVIDLADFLSVFLGRQQVAEAYRRVRVHLPSGLPRVRVGGHHLERMLGNLIENALKYSGEDQPVEIEGSADDGRVCLTVQDHGNGIAAEDLPHIFDRFYRTRNGRRKTGTGLGLYITRLLVEAYNGSIRVESAPGRGSRFSLCLPQVPPPL